MKENNMITKQCIIEEYLNNWFTYEELSKYLCVDINQIKYVLDTYCSLDEKLRAKIANHRKNITNYYETIDQEIPFITEDNQIYIDIANYIIKTKKSIRETAKEFNLGKTTVHEYIHNKLPKISIKHYKKVFDVLMENKSFSTNNKQVIEQVLTSYNYLATGHTIEEIRNIQDLSWSIVQRNLSTRLKKIDKKKYEEAKKILKTNQLNTLKEHSFKFHDK